jgi:FkbM family methyltransferase
LLREREPPSAGAAQAMLKSSAINAARPANSALGLRRCRYGTMMYLRRDMYVGRSLDLYGEYSEGEVALFRQVLAAGDTVLDIGANIGAHTVAMAQLVGPAGSVYAFEAQRVLLQILCGNVALNEFANVHAFPSAAGRARGRIAVPALDYTRVDNFGGIAIGQGGGEEVDLVAVDELRLRQVKLIKIDVEGMELEVLHGAAHCIAKHRPIMLIETLKCDKDAVSEWLKNSGYLTTAAGMNFLAIHNGDQALAGLKAAKPAAA